MFDDNFDIKSTLAATKFKKRSKVRQFDPPPPPLSHLISLATFFVL